VSDDLPVEFHHHGPRIELQLGEQLLDGRGPVDLA
jgi:hypothetical protein